MIKYKVYFRLTFNKEMSMIAINESSDDHLIFDDYYSGVNAWRTIPTHAVLNLLSTADGSWVSCYCNYKGFPIEEDIFGLNDLEKEFLKVSKDQTIDEMKEALRFRQ